MAALMDLGARMRIFQEFASNESSLAIDKYCYYHVYLLGALSKLDEATIQKNFSCVFTFAYSHDLPTIYLLE